MCSFFSISLQLHRGRHRASFRSYMYTCGPWCGRYPNSRYYFYGQRHGLYLLVSWTTAAAAEPVHRPPRAPASPPPVPPPPLASGRRGQPTAAAPPLHRPVEEVLHEQADLHSLPCSSTAASALRIAALNP